ncbi:MAG: FAD-binding oxidoreductase, partial [Flavobacteriales bacterium]|nr:FAD-binding oxidoreductase [Flavobacteriales bacterium]
MAQRTTHDVMVVGHGLAGTCLAIELERRGAKVLVFDHPMPGSASTAAAGLVNPVSLRRIVPVWRALEMLQKARAFYRSFEADSGVRLWHDMPLFKVFSTAEAASFWLRRATDPDLFDLVEDRV